MKKNSYFLVSFIAISAIILVACTTAGVDEQSNGGEVISSDIPSTQPPSTQIVSPVDTVAPPAPSTEDVASKPPGELPPIPEVQFGPGSDWFRPTPPETIQLASGGLQLFEFSAVW